MRSETQEYLSGGDEPALIGHLFEAARCGDPITLDPSASDFLQELIRELAKRAGLKTNNN